ncbi:hypothetical protein F5B19DRAFT_33837 [Rostrohypoxylon terebratum]|nr:hypothetical protein F5B19DRAFT_33837 [Rostrohypoxylon terebratum]
MAANTREDYSMSAEQTSYVVNHVFLPSQLPQQDDYDERHEEALLVVVLETLRTIRHKVKDCDPHVIESIIDSLQTLRASVSSKTQLAEAFNNRLVKEHGTLVYHVKEQNAGIMFTRSDTSVHVEVFELSAKNEFVMSTIGRLRRVFPGSSLALPLETFQQAKFRDELAHTLVKMTNQRAPNTKPQVKKANKEHDEDRDTTHPKMVTDFLPAILSSLGKTVEVKRILKHTREEVLWDNCKMPWHRSALWLLLRVALQLQFSRSATQNKCPREAYKMFMLCVMADILRRAHDFNFSSDLLSAMSSKLSRRRQKISGSVPESIVKLVESSLSATNGKLQERWLKIQTLSQLPHNMGFLKDRNFESDTQMKIPELGHFLKSIDLREEDDGGSPVRISTPLDTHRSSKIPNLHYPADSADMPYKLAAIETWVAHSLPRWIVDHGPDLDTCCALQQLISTYFEMALKCYRGNPETTSIMILTVMELWVASDKSAVQMCALLGKYDPGVPMELLENLNLPLKEQMRRLKAVEKYLISRKSQTPYSYDDIFGNVRSSRTFAVMYFDQSTEHQQLRARIEKDATSAREKKREEFRKAQTRYHELMRLSNQATHKYTENVNSRTGEHSWDHDVPDCLKCQYEKKANNLGIHIHEWPLSSNEFEARSTVFELRVPPFYGYWRDTTTFILYNVLGAKYTAKKQPNSVNRLTNPLTNEYFQPFGPKPRIGLLSQVKSHTRTHRDIRTLCLQGGEDDICLENGLRYMYYDDAEGCFVNHLETTETVPKLCTYSILDKSTGRTSSIQQFIDRPASKPHGPPPNKVLASQSDCPLDLSLEEYKALASLPLGSSIQWQNILVQLAMPSVDFKKEETVLVILQCIFQAGPRDGDEILRPGHIVLADEPFARALLRCLREALERIKENWQSFQALGNLVAISRRLLSLTPAETISRECLSFLADTRQAAMKWIQVLDDKIQSATNDKIRRDLRYKMTRIALICADTFNIDEKHLSHLLSSPDDACTMIRCSIAIQEGLCHVPNAVEGLELIMRQRWDQLAYRSFSILSKQITEAKSHALSDAVRESWPDFRPTKDWRVMDKPRHHWLETSSAREENGFFSVHISLLTGELLVNGSPLSRLPKEYERHKMYPTLFGKAALEAFPSSVSGMIFALKKEFKGHRVYLGMTNDDKTMYVRADRKGLTFEVIPPQVFEYYLPTEFVDNFVHWYNKSEDCVEFCPRELPWVHSKENWRLVRSEPTGSQWRLVREGSTLINMRCNTAERISNVFFGLEKPSWIHIILHGSSLDIELPSLKLGFYTPKGETMIYSRQFRGMVVDESQLIGTLIGLRSKLVLRGREDGIRRKVIIPDGKITFFKTAQHVEVRISHDLATRIHVYEVDNLLGRLINNSSLQSRLLMSYLHALTSYPLPDTLTGRTGTENALAILKSAAVRSFKCLTEENISLLVDIAKITPSRVYYPKNEKDMQTVIWSENLGFLAQHSQFYQIVGAIFRQAIESNFLYPESKFEKPELQEVDPKLLHRDLIRSSSFRTIGFGTEDFTKEYDVDYKARDSTSYSSQAYDAFSLSSMVLEPNFRLRYEVRGDVGDYLWQFVQRVEEIVQGPMTSHPVSSLRYDAKSLLGSDSFVAVQLPRLHKLLTDPNTKPSKFQIMFWLATLAYDLDADLTVLQVLASFFIEPRMAQIAIPDINSFDVSHGFKINSTTLTDILEGSCLEFYQSPEANLPQNPGETYRDAQSRRHREYRIHKNTAVSTLVSALMGQWPCETPNRPNATVIGQLSPYIYIGSAMSRAQEKFKLCFHNRQLMEYFDKISQILTRQISHVELTRGPQAKPFLDSETRFAFPSNAAVLSPVAPLELPSLERDILSPSYRESSRTPRLPSLLSRLTEQAQSGYEKSYVEDLESSVKSLQNWRKEYHLPLEGEEAKLVLTPYRDICQELVEKLYAMMCETLQRDLRDRKISSQHWPRLCPIFFLERLSHRYWGNLPENWKKCIVHYGVAITHLQRAQRSLRMIHNQSALVKELRNPGHTNWKPEDLPDSLLLEIESDLMIREVQEQIATHMRSPESGNNSVMQLNMGEGKSSVIVPAVAAALADGKKMVRVIVGKPQSKQMFQMLVSKLGGLLDRKIYHMPFSRVVKVNLTEIKAIIRMFQECQATGGVFLVQPEHILSFKLMGIECISTERAEIGRALAQLQVDSDSNTRDIVDESDENFSVKFELVYTMGKQRPTEFSPDRWKCIHQVLDIVRTVVSKAHSELPQSVELRFNAFGCFPWTRILTTDVADLILRRIATRIGEIGLEGFPITRQPEHILNAVKKYITEPEPGVDVIALVEDEAIGSFWRGSKDTLLLLRGLIAEGVLAFAFGHKRWRVDYGLDASRSPPTKLAVPYRAKDSPSPRSEFSHPDVVILLTSLSYYYGGLSYQELLSAFNHLFKSDQAESKYGEWVRAANDLDPSFRKLVGINLEDVQCTEHVFKNLRFVKEVIDYFLAYIVFPKEMREFPQKLSASGWDLGEVKAHPTTGFSGTNDSRKVLPLHVEQLDLDDQKHTNALVLEYLLQPENSVEFMPPHRKEDESVAETLLDIITKMEPPTRVILDVGAQILELDNLGVATKWLQKNSHDEQIRAAIYFDNNDELCVIDREGHAEPLQASPYVSQLGSCLVFLDEAHTRGTDLKLPKDYRAAVTLGANLTKDRLVQACMRMRMLGEGQSVVFCVPEEIQAKIRRRNHKENSEGIAVLDILAWAIGETWSDIHRSMGLWANQGRRHEKHLNIWEQVKATNANGGGIVFDKSLAESYLEDESQTLERRYRPRIRDNSLRASPDEAVADPITKRCREFANLNIDASTLQEEEERELSPEIEQEREDQRPAAAEPARHSIHMGVKAFISSCFIREPHEGYKPAFTALEDTTAARDLFDVSDFPTGLLVSADFARTIVGHRKGIDTLDFYQRSVQWILTGALPNEKIVRYMMVISPYEAEQLLPKIQASKVFALHLYAPQSTLGYRPLDKLDLYTVPQHLSTREIPQRLITELNLFAGQLYFNSFDQYVDACKFMGISYETPGEGEKIAADGFILHDKLGRVGGESGLPESPVSFFKMLHTKIRHNCESISKTHIGKLLDNQLLKPEDFADQE